MNNPILSQLSQTANKAAPQQGNILMDFINFRNQIKGQDPKQLLQNLISSGQMSQQQFDQLKQQAQSMLSMLK